MTERDEIRIYQWQRRWIRRTFGLKAAQSANYGWFVDDDTVMTKIYGHGVLKTWIDDGVMMHDYGF